MTIRAVQTSDAVEWLRMRRALFPGSNPDTEAQEIAHFLAVPPRPVLPTLHAVFVCPRPDAGLCGLVEVSIHGTAPGCKTEGVGYLEAWYVDPDCRGEGAGRELVNRAEAWARSEGCLEMASDTNPSYPVSPAAHAALGYQEVERYFRKDLRGHIMFSKVDYIMVNVSEMGRSVAFYRDTLGLPLKMESPGWSEFDTGASTLALHAAAPRAASGDSAQGGPAAGTCSIGFSVENLDTTYADLQARGARFVMPPTDQPNEGIRLAVCVDPDGLAISFAEMIAR